MKKLLLLFSIVLILSCGGSAETPKYGVAEDPNVIDTMPADSVDSTSPIPVGEREIYK